MLAINVDHSFTNEMTLVLIVELAHKIMVRLTRPDTLLKQYLILSFQLHMDFVLATDAADLQIAHLYFALELYMVSKVEHCFLEMVAITSIELPTLP